MEGILTLEDLIEKIIDEIRDVYAPEHEKLIILEETNLFSIKGHTPVKEVNQRRYPDIPVRDDGCGIVSRRIWPTFSGRR